MRKTDGVEVKFKEIVITANVDLFIYVFFFKSLNLIFKRIVFETENKQLKNEYYLYIYQYTVVIFSSFFFTLSLFNYSQFNKLSFFEITYFSMF